MRVKLWHKPFSITLLLWISVMLAFPEAMAVEAYFNDAGYRQSLMRSPTPESVAGAETLDPEALQRLISSEPMLLLIDVLPLLWRGIFIETDAHLNIPGSHWLPNVGKAELDQNWQSYLENTLYRLTRGDALRPMVIYCKADCWHSWNAAKRIVSLGYKRVYWYPLGVEGWSESGQDLVTAHPEPVGQSE